jgi:hypothetical protein
VDYDYEDEETEGFGESLLALQRWMASVPRQARLVAIGSRAQALRVHADLAKCRMPVVVADRRYGITYGQFAGRRRR